MTLIKHEMRQARTSLVIWIAAIASMLVLCIMIYPSMKGDMQSISRIFSAMGAFTAAFGMDRINFGELMGFYCVECGNILGLGGAMFAAMTGIQILAKEEREHTAEFLLTHPVSRKRIVTEKLIAGALQIVILNGAVLAMAAVSVAIIREEPGWKEFILIHLAYTLLQLEIAAICFGISAYLKYSGLGLGLGLALVLYCLNLVANITDKAEFLKYITPFGYCEGADILAQKALNIPMVAVGMVFLTAGLVSAYRKYGRKDMAV